MKFSGPIEAIEFWLDWREEGGVPLTMVTTDFASPHVQTSPRKWLPGDELSMFIDIDRAVAKLSDTDVRLILHYGKHVYRQPDQLDAWNDWQYRDSFIGTCKRFWAHVPRELGGRMQHANTSVRYNAGGKAARRERKDC